jgi:YVTN family beta-propeller protein
MSRGLLTLAATLLVAGAALHAATVRIVQTNAAGDSVMLIDPATNTVVGEIKDIEVNHGAAAAPDGSRLYVTDEPNETVDVVDLKTLKIIKKVPLTNRPNNISVSKDGTRVRCEIHNNRWLWMKKPGDAWQEEAFGTSEIMFIFKYGSMPMATAEKSMRVFAREVMPALKPLATRGI